MSGAVREEIFSQRYQFRSLEYEQERVAVTFGARARSGGVTGGEIMEAREKKNQDLRLQLTEERRARLELVEIVDGMRRGQDPRGGKFLFLQWWLWRITLVASLRAQFCPCASALRLVARGRADTHTFIRKVLDRGWSQKVLERVIVIGLET
ncbi:hypothetical protein Tco_0199518 [Tanacetum coccineum]